MLRGCNREIFINEMMSAALVLLNQKLHSTADKRFTKHVHRSDDSRLRTALGLYGIADFAIQN